MKKGRDNERQCKTRVTVPRSMSKLREIEERFKNRNNQCDVLRHLSEIKLKRTDTTLDPINNVSRHSIKEKWRRTKPIGKESWGKKEEIMRGEGGFI